MAKIDLSNEFGDYLPESEAQLEFESELIQAFDEPDAERKCNQIAKRYGGIDPEPRHTGQKGYFDCRFKVWRKD